MEINDNNLWIKTAADLIVRDFLAPAGYTIKAIPPIRFGWPCYDIDCRSGAETLYDGDTMSLVEIVITAWTPDGNPISGEKAVMFLAHEMIHVAISPTYTDRDDHERPEFKALHDQMGLEGNYHASRAGPAFEKWVDDVVFPEYERRLNGGDVR